MTYLRTTRRKIIAWFLLPLFLMGLFGVAFAFPIQQLARANPPESTRAAKDPPPKNQSVIKRLEDSIAKNTEYPDRVKFLEDKIKYFEYQQTAEVVRLTCMPTFRAFKATEIAIRTSSPNPTKTPGPRLGLLTGIIDDPMAPIERIRVLVTNLWNGAVDNYRVQVFAGALNSDPSQGVLIVKKKSSDAMTLLSEADYLAPFKTGKLKILDIQNQRLILSTETGEMLYFDVTTREFSASLENWAPLPAPILGTPEPAFSPQTLPLDGSTPTPNPYP